MFTNDFVAENEQSGIRVETTIPGPTPAATLRGVGLACNHKRVLGACLPAGRDRAPRTATAQVETPVNYPTGGEPAGFGVTVDFGLFEPDGPLLGRRLREPDRGPRHGRP